MFIWTRGGGTTQRLFCKKQALIDHPPGKDGVRNPQRIPKHQVCVPKITSNIKMNIPSKWFCGLYLLDLIVMFANLNKKQSRFWCFVGRKLKRFEKHCLDPRQMTSFSKELFESLCWCFLQHFSWIKFKKGNKLRFCDRKLETKSPKIHKKN